jgi:hypothetical protein
MNFVADEDVDRCIIDCLRQTKSDSSVHTCDFDAETRSVAPNYVFLRIDRGGKNGIFKLYDYGGAGCICWHVVPDAWTDALAMMIVPLCLSWRTGFSRD